MKHKAWMAGIAASLVALSHGALAQQERAERPAAADGSASPAATAAGAAALSEEITVLRAVKALRATPDQLAKLSTAVAGAHERLEQQEQTDLRAVAAQRDKVVAARRQVFGGGGANPPGPSPAGAEQVVTNAQRTAQRNQERLRDELAASLQRQLQTLLSPQQTATVTAQGQALVAAERTVEDREQALRQQQRQQAAAARGAPNAGAGRGRSGRRGGGAGDQWNPRMLDRMRQADANAYQRMARSMAGRLGDEGTPAYQNAMAAFDRIRSMPDSQFRRERADLTRQLGAAITAPRSAQNAALTISAESATRSWVRRYLLSPQAPAALAALSGTKSESP